MRALLYCGTASKGGFFDEARQPKTVRFQSCINVHLSLLRANKGRMYGYLLFQEYSKDPEDWGKLEVFEYPEIENGCAVRAYVPRLAPMAISGFGTVISHAVLLAFNGDVGRYPVDVLITQDPLTAKSTSVSLSTCMWDMPCVLRLESALTRRGVEMTGPTKADVSLISAMGRAQTWPVFLSEDQRTRFTAAARAYLSPSVLMAMQKNSCVLPNSIDVEDADRVVASIPAPTEAVVGYFGNQIVEKRTDVTIAVYESLHAAGRVSSAVFTTQSEAQVPVPGWIERHERVGKEYLQHARRAKVMVFASPEEGWPIAVMQVMAVGVVVVQVDALYARLMYPPDYPFFFKTPEQAYERAVAALASYDEWSVKLQDWVRRNYDERVVGARAFEYLQRVVNEHSSVAALSVAELRGKFKSFDAFKKALPDSTMTLSQLRACVGTVGRSHVGSVWSSSETAQVLKKLGYVDTLRSAEPVYERCA